MSQDYDPVIGSSPSASGGGGGACISPLRTASEDEEESKGDQRVYGNDVSVSVDCDQNGNKQEGIISYNHDFFKT